MKRQHLFIKTRNPEPGTRNPRNGLRVILICILLVAVAAAGCSRRGGTESGAGALKVVVSIAPQAYFVERVGGKRVEVDVLVEPGQSPHTYEPTPKQITSLSKAKVYFKIGVPFERALAGKLEAGIKGLKVVDTRRGIVIRSQAPGEHDHEEGHAAEEFDTHIWLDPKLVKIQAATVRDELTELDPAGADEYGRNFDAFAADLDAVDRKIAAALAPLRGREFFVFHPAFGYFGAAYGLKQVSVETGGTEPSAKRLSELVAKARADGVRVIFVQPQFSPRSAEAVAAAIGGAVVPMDPLARDYLRNLEQMAERIKEALGN